MAIPILQESRAETSPGGLFSSQAGALPGVAVAGNTLVAVLTYDSPTDTVSTPAGWDKSFSIFDTFAASVTIFTRLADAGDEVTPPTITITFGSTRLAVLFMFEVEGEYGGASVATTGSTPTMPRTFPAITPTASLEALLVAIAAEQNAYALSSGPSGYTLIPSLNYEADTGASIRLTAHYKYVASASGSYTTSITYANGGNGVSTHAVHVWFSGLTEAPVIVAAFSGTPTSGPAPTTVEFTDESTGDPDTWDWDFGDGGTSTDQHPDHEYTVPGTYSVTLTITKGADEASVTHEFYIVIAPPAEPGVLVDWDGTGFVSERVKEWTITRGASPELTGSTSAGSATIVFINTPDDRYNPENVGGDLYGFLADGPRLWIGVNEDGTVTPDEAKDVYGLHAGRITDVLPETEGGADVVPFVTIVTEDPLAWAGRQKIQVPASRERSQADLRATVASFLAWTNTRLPVEPATLPLSSADAMSLRVLDDLNAANGTRHFAKPADNATDWFQYYAWRRTEGLDGSSDGSLDAGTDHLTQTTGWRRSADGIINQQKATVEPIDFPGRVKVWEPDLLPFTVAGELIIWTQFGDYVEDPEVDIDYTGSALTTAIEAFGDTAKVTLTSAGTTTVTDLDITGYLVQRGSTESVVIDDDASQAEPRGVRAGPDLTGDYLGTLTSAKGFAEHIVYRFAGPLYRPTITVVNWIPEQFDLDLFDRISVTVTQLSITARIFEIVGLTHHTDLAALDGDDNPVVLHTTTYVLQECREQTDPGWFILDDSLLDGADVLAY
jgi:PKD repeat protein